MRSSCGAERRVRIRSVSESVVSMQDFTMSGVGSGRFALGLCLLLWSELTSRVIMPPSASFRRITGMPIRLLPTVVSRD